EAALQEKWIAMVTPLLEKSNLIIPSPASWKPIYGGRKGEHTEHLQPLLKEMTEVYTIDPSADW
ncbi:MAG TPA: phenylacetate-CoA oxygenase subunit PaaI, partial [Bacteroidetes bacterium]|nr:phenylacetate-CoA oxygenase subunit PaaI [Bacteroidota bacterium]